MNQAIDSAISDFIESYENSSLRREEILLDEKIKNDKELSLLAKDAQQAIDQIVNDRHDPEPVKKLASIKREYYSNDLVKLRFSLTQKMKKILGMIENTLDNSPKDKYKGL